MWCKILVLVAAALCGSAAAGGEVWTPKPGDFVFSTNPKIFRPLAYRLAVAGPPTHAAMVVRRRDGSLALLEALAGDGVKLNDLTVLYGSGRSDVLVRRLRIALNHIEESRLQDWVCRQDGKPYAGLGPAMAPAVGLPIRVGPVTRRALLDTEAPGWFCSQLAVAAGVATGRISRYDANPRFTDPQDLCWGRVLDIGYAWERPIRIDTRSRTTQHGQPGLHLR